jgi:hypothetical protein
LDGGRSLLDRERSAFRRRERFNFNDEFEGATPRSTIQSSTAQDFLQVCRVLGDFFALMERDLIENGFLGSGMVEGVIPIARHGIENFQAAAIAYELFRCPLFRRRNR